VTTVAPSQAGIPVRTALIQSQASAVNPRRGNQGLGNVTGEGGGSALKPDSSIKTSPPTGSYSFHTMAEDHSGCTAINPKTSFLTSDYKAEVDFYATVSSSVQVQFAYRSDNSRDWILYFDSGVQSYSGTYCFYWFINISGYQAANLSPRAFMVRVYLDGSAAFDEFIDVTDHNFTNSAFETATGVDSNGNPINPGKATFTVGQDSTVYAYVGINDAAYCSESGFAECRDTNGHVHDLYVMWYHGGAFDHDKSAYWGDYKNQNINYNYWGLIYDNLDYMSIDVSKLGTWDLYFYLDYYYNGGSNYWYGPVAHIQFTVQQLSGYSVTFNTNPTSFIASAGTITFSGTTYSNGQTGSYSSADYSATANAPTDYQWHHWEYSGSSGSSVYVPNTGINPTTVQVRGNGWVKAVFAAKVTFHTNPSNQGSISWGSCSNTGQTDGQTIFDPSLSPEFGNSITVCANVPSGRTFGGWSTTGGLSVGSSSANPTTVTFTGPGSIMATFTQTITSTSTSWTTTLTTWTSIFTSATTSTFWTQSSTTLSTTVTTPTTTTSTSITSTTTSMPVIIVTTTSTSISTMSATTISLTATPSSISLGSPVILSGSIAQNPGIVQVTISMSQDSGSTWTILMLIMTEGSGSYSTSWTPPYPGNYLLKSSWSGKNQFAGSTSSPASLTVTGAVAPISTLLLSVPSSASRGQLVTLVITVFNPTSSPLNGNVTVQITGPNNYASFNVVQVQVAASSQSTTYYDWTVPNQSGTYTVTVGLLSAKGGIDTGTIQPVTGTIQVT